MTIKKTSDNKLSLFGIIVSVLYTGLIVAFRWDSLSSLKTMHLNEFGDFFAGVFGPLMLFWLILGFVQQQKELRQNTLALEMQAEELKKSVDQHRELVAATREQVLAENKAYEMERYRIYKEDLPKLSVIEAGKTASSGKKTVYAIKIKNSGKPAYGIKFETEPSIGQIDNLPIKEYIDTDAIYKLGWDSVTSRPAPKTLKLRVNCKDSSARAFSVVFTLEMTEGAQRYHQTHVSEDHLWSTEKI